MTWMLVRLVLSLAFVGLVLWFAARVAKKRGIGGGGTHGLIEVVARQRMGRASSVNVVRIGDVVLVVGATEEQVTLLAEVDSETIDGALREREDGRPARLPARTPAPAPARAHRYPSEGHDAGGYDSGGHDGGGHDDRRYDGQGYDDRRYDDRAYDHRGADAPAYDGEAYADHDAEGYADRDAQRYGEHADDAYAERGHGGRRSGGHRSGQRSDQHSDHRYGGVHRPAASSATSGPLAGSVFDKNGWGSFVNELRERTVRRP